MNYFEQHVGDTWLLIAELSPLQRGIFHSLQLLYFRDERPLVDDPARLRAWCVLRRRTEFEALEHVLATCFELGSDGAWHIDAWDEQIAEYQRGEPERAARRAEQVSRSHDRVARQRDEERRLRAALSDIGRAVPKAVRGVVALRAFAEQYLGADVVAALRVAAGVAPASSVTQPAVTAAVTPVETRAVTLETPPQEPSPSSHFPSSPSVPPGPDGGLDVDETQNETPGVTAAVTPDSALQQRVSAVAAELTAAGAPVASDNERLQCLVAAGYGADDVLRHRPDGGYDPVKVRHPGAYLLAAAIKANSDGDHLRTKPAPTVPANPAAFDPLRKAHADATYVRENAEHVARNAAAVRQAVGLRPAPRRAGRELVETAS